MHLFFPFLVIDVLNIRNIWSVYL